MTTVYLGYPPENVKTWILAHLAPAPAENRKTVFYFSEGAPEEHLIEGTLDRSWMIDNGYLSDNVWTKPITNVEIGTGVTSIGREAFSECTSLTSLAIPEGVTSIEYEAFQNCYNLTSVTIPQSVTNIGEGAFAFCEATIHVPNQTIKTLVEDSGFWGSIEIDGQTNEDPS